MTTGSPRCPSEKDDDEKWAPDEGDYKDDNNDDDDENEDVDDDVNDDEDDDYEEVIPMKSPDTAGKRKRASPGKRRGPAQAAGQRKAQQQAARARDSDEESEDDDLPTPGRRKKRAKMGRTGRTAGKKYPKEIQTMLGEANSLYINGNIKKAAETLSEVVRKCPSIPDPYTFLGHIFHEKKQYRQSLNFYKMACSKDSRNVETHRQTAREAALVGDLQDEYDALKSVYRLDPGDVDAGLSKARCLVGLGKPKQAIDQYRALCRRFPERLDIYADLFERLTCTTPMQRLNVQQCLAASLGMAVGARHLRPDAAELAAAWVPSVPDCPLKASRRRGRGGRGGQATPREIYNSAVWAAESLMRSLMEHSGEYALAAEVLDSLLAWLFYARGRVLKRSGGGVSGARAGGKGGAGGDGGSSEGDSDEDGDSEEEEEEEESDGVFSDEAGEGEGFGFGSQDSEGERDGLGRGETRGGAGGGGRGRNKFVGEMTAGEYLLTQTLATYYGICQLFLEQKTNADKTFRFLDNFDAHEVETGDLMLEIAEAYRAMSFHQESEAFLRRVASSLHPRHRLAALGLGAALAARGQHGAAAAEYGAVLAERPEHKAALLGYNEAAYWRGGQAVAEAAKRLLPVIHAMVKNTEEAGVGVGVGVGAGSGLGAGAGSGPVPGPGQGVAAAGKEGGHGNDEEGEMGDSFQRLQILVQWATLSRATSMEGEGRGHYLCVIVPLLSHALNQMKQQKVGAPSGVAPQPGVARGRRQGQDHAPGQKKLPQGKDSGAEGKPRSGSGAQGQLLLDSMAAAASATADSVTAAGDANNTGRSSSNAQDPHAMEVKLIVDRKSLWLDPLEGLVLELTDRLCGSLGSDIRARLGRQSLVRHACLVTETLLAMREPGAAKAIADAFLGHLPLLRKHERDHLIDITRGAACDSSTTFPISATPNPAVVALGGSAEGGVAAAAGAAVDATPPDVAAGGHRAPSMPPPPWRPPEEGELGFETLVSGGREGRSRGDGGGGARSARRYSLPDGFNRRSRAQALVEMESAEGVTEQDGICAVVQALARAPASDALWNLLHRVMRRRGDDVGEHGGKAEAFIARHRERVPALLLRGHDNATWFRPRQALRLYAHAHTLRPADPLPLLCLAAQVVRVMFMTEAGLEDRQGCMVYAMGCLNEYAAARRKQQAEAGAGLGAGLLEGGDDGGGGYRGRNVSSGRRIPEAAVEQECCYNVGRGFHQIGVTHMAIEYYRRALRIEDERGSELRAGGGPQGRGVTREAAHNLCLLYKDTGSVALAHHTLCKYLAVG